MTAVLQVTDTNFAANLKAVLKKSSADLWLQFNALDLAPAKSCYRLFL